MKTEENKKTKTTRDIPINSSEELHWLLMEAISCWNSTQNLFQNQKKTTSRSSVEVQKLFLQHLTLVSLLLP